MAHPTPFHQNSNFIKVRYNPLYISTQWFESLYIEHGKHAREYVAFVAWGNKTNAGRFTLYQAYWDKEKGMILCIPRTR